MKTSPTFRPKAGQPGHTPHRADALMGRFARKASALAKDSVALHPTLVAWHKATLLHFQAGVPIIDPRRGK